MNDARQPETADNAPNTVSSAWSPLRLPVFRALWIATLASNIGTWMHDVGAGWLMTTLDPSPMMVALVQTAVTFPMFLLALPAGALSDIIDRRRYLIVLQVWLGAVAALLGVLTLIGVTTAWMLLTLTFAMGVGTAMMMPAWIALTPEVVPRTELQSAIALNSMGINVGRAIGPGIAGVIVSLAGSGAVFLLNAVSYTVVIVVLARWQREHPVSELPAERFFSALRSGLRFARHQPDLHAAIVRGCAFVFFASASWALLPLVAKGLENGGPEAFGLLLATMGVGAVAGGVLLPRLGLSRDRLVAAATVLYAFALAVLSTGERLWLLCIAMGLIGMAWISVLASLQVAAQLALPDWVRARGLAVFMTGFMGALALGSVIWGRVAQATSVSQALQLAAAGALVAAIATWRWQIAGTGGSTLTASMRWPTPIVHDGVTHDRGPVLINIDYAVREECVADFLHAVRRLGKHRKRDGAFAWGIFEDTLEPRRFIESFNTESWLEHLRQHERVTGDQHELQAQLRDYLVAGSEPRVRHFVAP